MALGQVVTKIVGHVDTACDMKQVYSIPEKNIKVKICNILSKWLELIKIEPKKFSNVADLIL